MTNKTLALANNIKKQIQHYEKLIKFLDNSDVHLIKKKYFLCSQTPLDGHYEMELDGNDILTLINRNGDKIKVLKYLLETLNDDNADDYHIDFKNLIEIGTSKRILDAIKEQEKNET